MNGIELAAGTELRVQTEDFDVGEVYSDMRSSDSGACVLFVGLARDFSAGRAVEGLELEHFPGMVEQALDGIVATARQRWSVHRITVIHRVGRLHAGDQIVLVAVSSRHRHDAFASCEYIMDYLKTEVPIWKKEFGPAGAEWVESRDSDTAARARWERREA